jgi:hypothetical protein
MVINTNRRKVNIIPQNMEDPEKPKAQKPETTGIGITPSNFKQDSTETMSKSLDPRKNSPEE